MKPEQERLRNLLYETITMLCKNGLSYKRALKVQGLLAVTVDEEDVFIVHLDDRIEDAVGGFVIPVDCNGLIEPLSSSASNASKQLPDISQGFTGNAIQQFELFNDHTNAVSASERTESDVSQEPLICKILKVEPLADDFEENAGGMDIVRREVPLLEQTKDDSTMVEAESGQQEALFGIDLASSNSQNFPSAIDYRVVCDSDSEMADISRKDSASDVKVTVPLVSSSLKAVSAIPDRSLNRGTAVHGNSTFPNLCIDTSLISAAEGATTKVALPKPARSFLPVVPGFTNQQQVSSKSDRPLLYFSQRHASRLPRRPRESTEKHFVCPFCGLAYYYKKHLKFHLKQKHGL